MGMGVGVVILAAGQGTRMRSPGLPKVLHRLGSLSLVERVVRAVLPLAPDRIWVVVGYGQNQVRQALQGYPVTFVEQTQQRGTGHAVQQVIPHLEGFSGSLLILNGDVPLLRPETLKHLLATHTGHAGDATILTALVADPQGYGRVFCDSQGRVTAIIEEKDCTPEQRLQRRVNGGVYCFRVPALLEVLPRLQTNNQQQEYYLTDAVTLVNYALALDVEDADELLGINDRLQLAQAYQVWQNRLKRHWMAAGVTIWDPDSVSLDDEVVLAADVVLEPQTHLRGTTQVGAASRIGPGSVIENSQIGQHCQVVFAVVSDSQIGDYCTVGPYTHIRQNSVIADHCRLGNFVEVKKTHMGSRSNAAHLAYLGDGVLGEQVNIGAGTIFANYDGRRKHQTVIGSGSKTGANSVLVAPIQVGKGVTIAAGSTITEDVPDDCLVIARARAVLKPGWRLPE
ncbi:MAG: bifunctional UDP-N-acetylglucosamine diphosphorylase/glucosamine-1-phosphate N-acetyltransferase GlmU [Thermostichales cyanobacterium SRBZ-1_bins_19]